jgi:hypothetical protein
MTAPMSLITSGFSNSLATAVRAAREIDFSDPIDVIRTDIGDGIDVGRELVGGATEALADAVSRWERTRRPTSRRRPAMLALAIGIVGAIVLFAWWRGRRSAVDTGDTDGVDRVDLERAADDGMGMAIGSPTPTPEHRELVPVVMESAAADESAARSA